MVLTGLWKVICFKDSNACCTYVHLVWMAALIQSPSSTGRKIDKEND